jgi:hypothetical protein
MSSRRHGTEPAPFLTDAAPDSVTPSDNAKIECHGRGGAGDPPRRRADVIRQSGSAARGRRVIDGAIVIAGVSVTVRV